MSQGATILAFALLGAGTFIVFAVLYAAWSLLQEWRLRKAEKVGEKTGAGDPTPHSKSRG